MSKTMKTKTIAQKEHETDDDMDPVLQRAVRTARELLGIFQHPQPDLTLKLAFSSLMTAAGGDGKHKVTVILRELAEFVGGPRRLHNLIDDELTPKEQTDE